MFSGLVADVGRIVSSVGNAEQGMRLQIATNLLSEHLALGASVACNGVCLTVTECSETTSGHTFWVDISPESLRVTSLGQLQEGMRINLEPSLRVGDAIGGHWVSGHVDGMAEVLAITDAGDGYEKWCFGLTRKLMQFIANRGSVCVDGVSLTVIAVEDETFQVNLIPHTLENTRFGQNSVGDMVNIEVDMMSRYVVRWQEMQKNQDT